MNEEVYLFWVLVIAGFLAFIPANIAKKKGRSFGLWWLYGFALWIVAFIHSLCLKDDNVEAERKYEEKRKLEIEEAKIKNENIIKQDFSKPDLLIKYKQLLDDGVITQEEFDREKKKILA